MVTVNAHFDDKVLVPDEPLDLRPNQALIVQIQPVEGSDEPALTWIAANAVESDALPPSGTTSTRLSTWTFL
jgi:hypothetical protein